MHSKKSVGRGLYLTAIPIYGICVCVSMDKIKDNITILYTYLYKAANDCRLLEAAWVARIIWAECAHTAQGTFEHTDEAKVHCMAACFVLLSFVHEHERTCFCTRLHVAEKV